VLHMSKNKQIYMGAQSIKQCFWLGGCIWFLDKQEIFLSSPHKDHPWGQSSHISNWKLSLFIWGKNKQCMNLITYLHLALRFRMHGSSSPQIWMHFRHRDNFTLTSYLGQEAWDFSNFIHKTCMSSVQFLLVLIPLLPAGLYIKHADEFIHWASLLHTYTKWIIVLLFCFVFFSIKSYKYMWWPILFQCSWCGQYLYVQQTAFKTWTHVPEFHIYSICSICPYCLRVKNNCQCIYFPLCFLRISGHTTCCWI
jgi:hypothetical protein